MTSPDTPNTLKEVLLEMLENYGVDIDDKYYDAPSPDYVEAINSIRRADMEYVIGAELPPDVVTDSGVGYTRTTASMNSLVRTQRSRMEERLKS